MSVQTSFGPVADAAAPAVRSESRQTWSELRPRQGGAAGERGETQFAGTDGGMKQAEEGVAGLTILKPDLAFLKAGVRHQLPSFPLQRHEQSFLPER